MRWELRRVADLTAGEQAAVSTLAMAVYPPEVSAAWPGRAIEWAPHPWGVIGWDAAGAALCYVGAVLREARWGERAVRVGGIGGVKTHPALRRQGLAARGMRRAMEFFHDELDVAFALLVCGPHLIGHYARLGWQEFPGRLLVRQHGASVEFTFNRAMTCGVRSAAPGAGAIDLLGPPW